jgi:hypothetical protein
MAPKFPTGSFGVADMVPDLSKLTDQIRDAKFHAKHAKNSIVMMIKKFEGQLDAQHEVGIRLASFGSSETLHIDRTMAVEPDILIFVGVTSSGDQVQLIQHYTQANVLLVAAKKMTEEPRRIGFLVDDKGQR